MLKKLSLGTRQWVENYKRRMSEKDRNRESVRKLTMCKKCFTFYYKNSWQFENPLHMEGDVEREVPVRFMECPACLEEEVSTFERVSEMAYSI